MSVDRDARSLSAVAAPLPGLGLSGYRALEARAAGNIGGWTIFLMPPVDTPLPDVAVTEGVVDDSALAAAAWGSARTARSILVSGGTKAQRSAVAEGIVARGGQAEPGPAAGALRLEWAPEAEPS